MVATNTVGTTNNQSLGQGFGSAQVGLEDATMTERKTLTWRQLGEFMNKQLGPKHLDKPVIGLIDNEPWEASEFSISGCDDDWHPNQPYIVFPN